MRFFDLIHQDYRVRPAPHRFGEIAALFVPDISRWGTDQPCNGVFLHKLGHIDPHHGLLCVEQKLRQRFGEFSLANPRWPKKEKRPVRPVRIRKTRPGSADRIRYRADGLVLPDDPLVQLGFHAQQLFPLALKHP